MGSANVNFRPAGPRQVVCVHCGKRLSSNALGKAAHLRACQKKAQQIARKENP